MHALFVTNPLDDMAKIQDTKDRHLEGTCSWISIDPTYKEWLHRDRSSILWVHGNPGKGKTMLAISQVTQLIERTELITVTGSTVSYFFCDDQDDRRNNAVVIIRSLLHQLLCQRPELVVYLRNDYEKQGDQLFSSVNAQQSCWRILESVLDKLGGQTIWFIVDALDECEPESARILLQRIKSRIAKKINEKGWASDVREKWLLTSRNEQGIKEIMVGSLEISLELNSTVVTRDVRQFVVTKVQELNEVKRYPEDLRTHITRTLEDKAEGTFLWVSLACAELRKVPRIKVERTLQKLPLGLNAIYERLLNRALRNEDKVILREILVSVLVAMRPLTVYELAVVAGITPEHSGDAESILEYIDQCGSILVIRKQSVYFVHQSAKDYLWSAETLSLSLDLAEEHKTLTIRCLDYVCSGVFDEGSIKIRSDSDTSSLEVNLSDIEDDMSNKKDSISISEDSMWISEDDISDTEGELEARAPAIKDLQSNNPPNLLIYPVLFWMRHGRLASPDLANRFDLKHEFYHSDSRTRKAWMRTYYSSIRDQPDRSPVLHFAAYSGVLPLVRTILDQGKHEIDLQDPEGGTPLYWAALSGHTLVVKLLLEKGASLNTKGYEGRTALHAAAMRGHENVVQLLLDNGAETGTKDIYGDTVLHQAVRSSDETVVQLLLEVGVDAENGIGETALHLAARQGSKRIIQLLLENGADIGIKDNSGNTVLYKAVTSHEETVVQLLLEIGVDFNAENSGGRTALHLAARWGSKNTVQLLLEKGADIDVKDAYGNTVLHQAVRSRSEAVVQLLLKNGADVNTKNFAGNTILHAAARHHSESIVWLLLKSGADIGTKDHGGNTALHEAVDFRDEAVVQLLLENRADVNAENFAGNTALHVAVTHGSKSIVQLLLEKGADGDTKDEDGNTALHKALGSYDETVVQLLLEIGLDVNATNLAGGTALHIAARQWSKNIVQLLLKHGADIGMKDNCGNTALHIAVKFRNETVVQLLFGNGLDVNTKNSAGITALDLAERRNYESIVQLLLSHRQVARSGDLRRSRSVRALSGSLVTNRSITNVRGVSL